MMSYRLWERKEDSFGGLPVERPHGEVVILPLSDSQLFLKILKGIEGVAGIESFIVLSMTALHFPVVPGGVGLNELMPDAELLQGGFKERFLFVAFEFRRFVNSDPLSVWIHSMAYGNCFTTYFRNCVEEYVLCSLYALRIRKRLYSSMKVY